MTDGVIKEKKLVQFFMSFVAKDSARKWAEHCSATISFPFPIWAEFKHEFWLQFIEENEQDQVLLKLEFQECFQGSHDVYQFTDDFKELAMTTGHMNPLV
jgi:hypothetical protein